MDIPEIHCFQEKVGDDFFAALAKTEDMSLFSNTVVKAVIDYKWPLVREYTIKFLFVPFIIYLATFIVFSNVFDGQIEADENTKRAKLALIIILYILSGYLFFSELLQIWTQRLLYFHTVWNIPDLLTPILVVVVISHHLHTDITPDYVKPSFIVTVHSFTSLFIWIKFLYFLRIYRPTGKTRLANHKPIGYLIRMLGTVIWDIRIFLFVLLIVYLGFGEAFLRLSQNSSEKGGFITNYADSIVYSFRLSIGDTSVDNFNDGV